MDCIALEPKPLRWYCFYGVFDEEEVFAVCQQNKRASSSFLLQGSSPLVFLSLNHTSQTGRNKSFEE
jgi:hypothetical protein